MPAEDVSNWIALNMIPGVGSSTFRRLLKFFGSPEVVLKASLKDLNRLKGLTPAVCQSIIDSRDKLPIQKELDLIQRHNCKVITIQDESYPANLKAIYDPPPLLYVKGDLLPVDSSAISVVGTRTASSYGKMTAEKLSGHLAVRGFTIVSGMAYGIDTAAHEGALNAGGRTIAVMGNGLSFIYPERNAGLLERIVSSGAAISEFPMATKPLKVNFPIRNRLISGMSFGTLVVEAPKRSGALLTAYCALEQDREVFAVPGQISSEMSSGAHELIKQGAKLVESVEDILEELPDRKLQPLAEENFKLEEKKMEIQLSGDERRIWDAIGTSQIHIDEISRKSALPSYKVSAVLVMLELKGLVQQSSGKMFTRKE